MSLNSIKFDTTDIALLFKNSLVEINEEQQVSTRAKNKPEPIYPENKQDHPIAIGWKYLGENKKKVLVIVRYAGIVHLPDKQLSFLSKLLAACNLNIGDTAILNFQDYDSADFDKIMNHFTPKVVLLFDTKPAEFGMPMNFPEFQVQGYKDAVFVSSPSLEIIEPDKNLKGKLWICLKKIFNL
jgi:hypothetical protein